MWNPFSKVKLTAEEKALPDEERKALIKSKKLQAHYDKELERAQEREQERVEKIEEKKRDMVYRDTVAYAKEQSQQEKVAPEGAFLSLQHINKIYGNHVQAVYDFNLDVKQHEFIVLVGPSGCGKSTTLRMIAGLEAITSGDLYIDGVYSNDLEPKDRNLAMVFQNYALYPHMSVYSNMAFGLKMRKVPKEEIDRRVHAAAKILQLEEYLDRKPGELSGGQCQRVALGRAIVRDTRLFLMDEPLSNLDAKLRVQMRSEIVNLHNTIGATTIYVTHDQTEAMTMASRIVVMKKGYVQQIGTPKEVYANPANVFVATFIGSPAMNIIKASFENGVVSFHDGFKIDLGSKGKKAIKSFYEQQSDKLKARNAELDELLANEDLVPSFREIYEEEKKQIGEKLAVYANYDGVAAMPIYFGIRPEDIHAHGVKSEATNLSDLLKVKVFSAEYLGKEYFVHADIGSDRIIAKIGAGKELKSGEEIELDIDLDKITLFDTLSELAIPLK